MLTNGWPGSIVEFLHLIEPLARPERFGGRVEDTFTVVVPSIPDYGFSQAPQAPITPRQVGHMWHQLMTQVLGFIDQPAPEQQTPEERDWFARNAALTCQGIFGPRVT